MADLNVKVGDRVAYNSGGVYGYRCITTVVKITPTGRIRVACTGSQFAKDGIEMGAKDVWSPRSRIYELTPELLREITMENTIKKCFEKMRVTKKLSYKQAVKILEALGDEEGESDESRN